MAMPRSDLNIIIDGLRSILRTPGTPITADAWNVATEYDVDDLVLLNNVVYRCILQHTGEEPPSATQWTTVSVKHPRGKITFDSANFQIAGYLVADKLLLGSAFGIPIFRDAVLANGIYEYYDGAGNLLATNA